MNINVYHEIYTLMFLVHVISNDVVLNWVIECCREIFSIALLRQISLYLKLNLISLSQILNYL